MGSTVRAEQLRLPSRTFTSRCHRIRLQLHDGRVGFAFLGFHVRQYPVGMHRTRTYRGKPGFKTLIKPNRQALQRHRDKLRDSIQQHRGAPQAGLVYALNPVIQGKARILKSHVRGKLPRVVREWRRGRRLPRRP
jgi:hypothetical protein